MQDEVKTEQSKIRLLKFDCRSYFLSVFYSFQKDAISKNKIFYISEKKLLQYEEFELFYIQI